MALAKQYWCGFSVRQWAWLEFHGVKWYLLASALEEPAEASRKWPDWEIAIKELKNEGWSVIGPYPNEISQKAGLGHSCQGFALMRTIH